MTDLLFKQGSTWLASCRECDGRGTFTDYRTFSGDVDCPHCDGEGAWPADTSDFDTDDAVARLHRPTGTIGGTFCVNRKIYMIDTDGNEHGPLDMDDLDEIAGSPSVTNYAVAAQ